MITAKDISNRLNARCLDVVKYLLPNGKRCNNDWCVGSIEGESGQSLKISLQGSKLGIWSDFADEYSGDLLDLWRFTRHISLSEAMKEAKLWLGITEPRFVLERQNNYILPSCKDKQLIQAGSDVYHYLTKTRLLSFDKIRQFQLMEQGRVVLFPFYRDDKIQLLKKLKIDRHNGKKIMSCEKGGMPCLFGWQAVPDNTRHIALTEGELDAISLSQYGIDALSIPFGGGVGNKHRWIDIDFERLNVFDKIYLCFDNDEVGLKTVDAIIDRLGRHRCYIVRLPKKDANACLQAGISSDDIHRCFQAAITHDPKELKSAERYHHLVTKLFYPEAIMETAYKPPWEKCQDKIVFRHHELSIWTGINGHGKSQFLGYMLLHAMAQGAKVCIASLEIKPERLLMRLTRQASACRLPTKSQIQEIHEWYEDRLWLFDLVGSAKKERLLEVFLYARQRYGIDVFLIDSLMKCAIADDDYQQQKLFVEQLCDFKNEHPCHIHLVAHPTKGKDEDHMPGKLKVKGSGTMTDLADNCFTVWRNKKKNNRADCVWHCDKQRNGEWEGKFLLWFDQDSFQYLDEHEHPSQFIKFNQETTIETSA